MQYSNHSAEFYEHDHGLPDSEIDCSHCEAPLNLEERWVYVNNLGVGVSWIRARGAYYHESCFGGLFELCHDAPPTDGPFDAIYCNPRKPKQAIKSSRK